MFLQNMHFLKKQKCAALNSYYFQNDAEMHLNFPYRWDFMTKTFYKS